MKKTYYFNAFLSKKNFEKQPLLYSQTLLKSVGKQLPLWITTVIHNVFGLFFYILILFFHLVIDLFFNLILI